MLFFKYLRRYLWIFLFFLLLCLVFIIVFFLYQIPVEAALYASAICMFLCAVAVIWSYLAYRRKYMQLKIAYREVPVSGSGLPASDDKIDEAYAGIIDCLYSSRQSIINDAEKRYTDMSEYYAAWVHQIKTPISSMRLILQSSDNPDNHRLNDELQKIEQYVDMALCYVRLNSSSTDYVIRNYDLDKIIRQALRKYASQFIYRKITLLYEPVSCTVLTDEKWLLFVIEQIISNSLKYTRTGSVSIYLEPDKTLCIQDTGIGISPEDLPRIFDKGYTGYNGRTDKKATGIGLYLCRKICTNMGHKISACSTPGEGTVIKLCLKSAELNVE